MHGSSPRHEERSGTRAPLVAPRWRLAALAAAVLPILAACGMLGDAIGPVGVGDPLDVDDTVVEADFSPGPIAPAAVAHGDHTAPIAISDQEIDLRGFAAGAFNIDAGFAPDVTVTGEDLSDPPESFTVTEVLFQATLEDANGSVDFAQTVNPDLLFELGTCDAAACTYSYAGGEPLENALDLRWTDLDKLATLVRILNLDGEPTPNTGSLVVTVEVDSEPTLAGTTAAFTLVSEGSTIELD